MNKTVLLDNENKASIKKRDTVIDLIKALAILGVVIIHVSTGANGSPIASFDWLCGNFYGSIARASVPLFLMCSGALFLNSKKPLSIKKLYTKNVLRLVIAMFFWATVYKLYNLVATNNLTLVNVISDIKNVLFFKQEFHLYYIQIMLLIYALLPVLRLITDNADKKALQYTLALWFILGVLYPTVAGFWPFSLLRGIPAQWKLNLVYNAVGYFIFGHYLKKYPLKLPASIISAILGFGIIYGGTVFMSVKNGKLYSGFIDGMTVGSFFLAAGLFCICIKIAPCLNVVAEKIVCYFSNASFCIYLVHMLILYGLGHFRISVSGLPIPAIASVPIIAAVCFAISIAVYFVLSHIPVVKKWLV